MLFGFIGLTVPHLDIWASAKTGETCGNTDNIGNLPWKDDWNPADPNPTLVWREGVRNIVLRSGERLIFAELLVLRSSDSGHVCWTTVEEDIVVVALTTSHDFHWRLYMTKVLKMFLPLGLTFWDSSTGKEKQSQCRYPCTAQLWVPVDKEDTLVSRHKKHYFWIF